MTTYSPGWSGRKREVWFQATEVQSEEQHHKQAENQEESIHYDKTKEGCEGEEQEVIQGETGKRELGRNVYFTLSSVDEGILIS